MAGNSSRRGAIKKTGKGNPTAGSGGRVKRGLEGRGPTPKAKDREGHKVYKERQRIEKTAAKKPRRPVKGGDTEWIAGHRHVRPHERRLLPDDGSAQGSMAAAACRPPCQYSRVVKCHASPP